MPDFRPIRPVRLAVVGCGRIACDYHGPAIAAYASTRALERVACCDADPSRAAAFAANFGFTVAETSLDRILDRHRPDAVMLFVAEHVAADIAIQIIRRGVHLLMEKPPGASLAEYRGIVVAAEAARVPVQVAFNRRTMPLVQRLRTELRTHVAAGDMQHLAYEFTRSERHDPDFTRTLIHAIDTLGFLAGVAWKDAELRYQELPELGSGVSSYHVLGRFVNGTTASISCCPAAGAVVERIVVHAAGRSFYLELPVWGSLDAPGRLRHVHCEQVALDLLGRSDDDPVQAWGFAAEDERFLDGVAAGDLDCGALASAGPAMAICEAMRARLPRIQMQGCVPAE